MTADSDRADSVLGRARTVSGICAAGLVVLAVALLVVSGFAASEGEPGPGPAMLFGHTIAAAAAVVLHRLAGRRTGGAGYLTALGPPAILLLLGVLFWWT